MYENINMGCVSKSDFIILCEDCVRERERYKTTGDVIAFVKYSTIISSIYTLGLDYEFRQFCAENKTMKEIME